MRMLIYSKLDAASGNTTLAARLARYFAAPNEVLLRPVASELPANKEALEAETQAEVAALRKLAAEHAIEMVIGIHCTRAGAPLDRAFSPNGPPFVLVASGTDLNVDLQQNSKRATLTRAISHASGIVSLSPALHDAVAALLAELPAATRPPHALILQAPDPSSASTYSLRSTLGLRPEQKLILLPAGIRPVKGVALAIESAAQALLEHPDHVLAILGPPLDPDYHAHCASLIGEWRLRHRELKGRLYLLGGLPRADYLAALGEADLLLNCSESEAISNAVLEALALGVPVLVRDIPGNRAIVTDGVNGLVFSRLTDFLRQFRRLFADPALARALIEGGRESYRQHCDPAAEKAAWMALIARAQAFRR